MVGAWILNLKNRERRPQKGGNKVKRKRKKKGKKNRETIFFIFHQILELGQTHLLLISKHFFHDTSLHSNFQKSFQKNKNQKNIERLKFLGRKPGPEGGQIPHYTRLVQHLFINHHRWSVAWQEDHPSENAAVVTVHLSGIAIKLT